MTITSPSEGTTVVTEIRLQACRPAPLGAYLRALGVLRVVGEQADPMAAGWWAADGFRLRSRLDREALVHFLLHRYRPTPVVAPWNMGSGFKVAGNPTAVEALARVESSTDPRLGPYRAAIEAGRAVLADSGRRGGWDKRAIVEGCRARLADDAVAWVDAAVVLAGDDPSFPPILGTGGNDGRFDFSVAFMQRLLDVLCLREGRRAPTVERSAAWLGASLFGDVEAELVREAVGQFDAGAAGGANSSPVGAAPSLVNPWSWVLLIEGALVFASAAARRLGAGAKGKAAMPFTVDASSVGYSSGVSGEKSRGELWAPLWERPATISEITYLVGEGRSEWRGRRAGSGIDMARATASLGVDRGIDAFERHVLLENRNGRATLALPAGRIRVGYRSEVLVAGGLDLWLNRVRATADKPPAVESAVRATDEAIYALATQRGAERLFDVLAAVALLEMAVGRSPQFRRRAGDKPLGGLPAAKWLGQLTTSETRLACGLASMRDRDGACLRRLLRPIVGQGRGLKWSSSPPPVAGFGIAPVVDVLAAAHVRRAIDLLAADRGRGVEGGSGGPTDRDDRPTVGLDTRFAFRFPVPGSDIARLVAGDLDQGLFQRALAAMLVLDWDGSIDTGGWPHDDLTKPPSPAWWVLAPFFSGRPIEHHRGRVRLLPQASWPAMLAGGAVEAVLDEAVRRLRIARLRPPFASSGPGGLQTLARCAPSGATLAAALLCPISTTTAGRLLDLVDPEPFRSDQEDER